MKYDDSAIDLVAVAPGHQGEPHVTQPRARVPRAAVGLGAAGVVAFSMSLVATRAAVPALGAVTVGAGRAVVAAALAGLWLWWHRAPLPTAAQRRRLLLVVVGVVLGFPLLSSAALELVGSAHGAVVIGLIPIATALVATVRAGERPSRWFWLSSAVGAVAVLAFSWVTSGALHPADLLLLAAVAAAAVGYAEGGALARDMPGGQVIAWALLLALPVTLPTAAAGLWWHPLAAVPASAWLGFGYVSVVSMFGGFILWYRGLALGGVARIGQLQLAQPVLTLVWSALLLGEHITAAAMVAAVVVLLSTATTQRVR